MLPLIRYIAIYPLESVIRPLHNWVLTIKTEANLIWKAKPIGYRLPSSWRLSYLRCSKTNSSLFQIYRSKKKFGQQGFFLHTPPPPLWGKMWRSSEQVRREYSQVSAHSFLHYDFRMWKVEFQACSKLSVKYLELRNGSLLFDTVTLIP